MTQTLDMTGATGLRVANVDALELRIANTTIWTTPAVEHSIWYPSAYPYAVNHAVFAGSDVVYSTAFYTNNVTATDSWIVGARLWIPAGTVSTTVTINLYNSTDVIGSGGFAGRFSAGGAAVWLDAPTASVTIPISGSGWHTARFTGTHKATVNAPFTIGYVLGTGAEAIWLDGITTGSVAAGDGYQMVMSPDVLSTRDVRSWKKDRLAPSTTFNNGRAYGLDVILSETAP